MAPSIALVAHDPRDAHRGLLRIPRYAGGVLVAGGSRRGPCVDSASGDRRAADFRPGSRARRARRQASPAILVSHSPAGFMGIRNLDRGAVGRHRRMERENASAVGGWKDKVKRQIKRVWLLYDDT